jgi:FixJ family two-component response regulator
MQDDMLTDFLIEADELFAEAEDALLVIEKDGDYQENFNSIFRTFHSIKGAAGMFALVKLQEHMHFLENLLEKKKNNTTMSSNLIDFLLSGIDVAKKLLLNQNCDFKYYDPDGEENISETQSVKEVKPNHIDSELKEQLKKDFELRQNKIKSSGLVYVVDDEEDILEMTQIQLESLKYEVKTFLSAKEALKALRTESPDVVITDISMPEMNGIEFMKEINKIRAHLPTIVVSGYLSKDVCIDALSCGVSGILEKPYDSEKLFNTVEVCIERYKAFKLLNKSIDLLVYQFDDFDKYLSQNDDLSKRDLFRI